MSQTLSTSIANGISLTADGSSGYQTPFTITSTGTILTGGNDGVYGSNAAVSVYVLNQGYVNAYQQGIDVRGAVNVVDNAGTIIGGDGVVLFGGTLTNSGSHAYIYGRGDGVVVERGGPGWVFNEGGTIASGYDGIIIGGFDASNQYILNSGADALIKGAVVGIDGYAARGTITVVNQGTIAGLGNGINGPNANRLIVANTGLISGGTYGISAYSGTFTNSGTIAGGNAAIDLIGRESSLLIVDPGAVFEGGVTFSVSASNTLELGAGAGSLSGVGTAFLNFGNISFAAGADWTLEGSVAGLAGGETITGFHGGDTIELDGFTAVSAQYVSGAGLEVSDGTSTVTLAVQTSFAGQSFFYGTGPQGTEITTDDTHTLSTYTANGITLSANGSTGYLTPFTITNTGTAGGGVVLPSGGTAAYYLLNQGVITGSSYGISVSGGGTIVNAGTIGGDSGAIYIYNNPSSSTGDSFLLVADPGAVFSAYVMATGFASNTLELARGAGSLSGIGTQFENFGNISFAAGADWTLAGNSAGLADGQTITGFNTGDTIVLDDFRPNSESYVAGTGLELSEGGKTIVLDIETNMPDPNFTYAIVPVGKVDTTDIQLLCFLQGTRILTPTGEVRVENLAIGDAVMTRFSGMQRVKWIGRQSHGVELAQTDAGKRPVCIKAGALGEGQPARDLYVSPGHSMLVQGELLLAGLLVNGVTVTQDYCPEVVEYYQIELEAHDCIVAEGAFAETYADCGVMRGQFANAAAFYALYPGYRPPEEPVLCAPRPEKGARFEAALRPVLARVAQAPGPLQGWVDRIAMPWTVEGWAWDEAMPACPVELEFLLDGEVLGTALACHFRADLVAAGYGTGRCGFSWTAPCDLPADAAARLQIRRVSDGTRLPGSAAGTPRLRVVGG